MRLAELMPGNEDLHRWIEARCGEADAGDELAAFVRDEKVGDRNELRAYSARSNGLILVEELGDVEHLRRVLWRDVGELSLRCEIGKDDVLWWKFSAPELSLEFQDRVTLATPLLEFAKEALRLRQAAP